MRVLKRVGNPGLLALIEGAGYRSLDRFAEAVNERAWHMYGIKLAHDHVTVKRWLAGGACQYPDVVAAVLSQAWGVPVPVGVIWPRLREGGPAAVAHLHPWVAARTLEQLSGFIGGDMLTRRESLARSVQVATGAAFVDPLARWLGMPAVGVGTGTAGSARVGMGEVVAIEQATGGFAGVGAVLGGGLSREAAVGQLKYAVDLVRYGSYARLVGDRLLAAVGQLSGVVGWLCHDCGMPGPAQRYLTYGLQAARESGHERAPVLVVAILADLARHARDTGQHRASLRLWEMAIDQLPADRGRLPATRALLWGGKAQQLAVMGSSGAVEARYALSLATDLLAGADEGDRITAGRMIHVPAPTVGSAGVELAGMQANTLFFLAQQDRRWVNDAEVSSQRVIDLTEEADGVRQVTRQLRLARVRFLADKPEQGTRDAEQALSLSADKRSEFINGWARGLMTDSAPYEKLPPVRQLRDRLWRILRKE